MKDLTVVRLDQLFNKKTSNVSQQLSSERL